MLCTHKTVSSASLVLKFVLKFNNSFLHQFSSIFGGNCINRAFTNYDLLLRALDASSIYLHAFRRVAPPKSGEDAHITRGTCDFGGATLNNPSLGCSYVLPRLWDPGGVSSLANTPSDLSRTIAPSRYHLRVT